ncbi:MAG: glucose-1-phosphate adenylyltransferase subunit GlgD [Anaeromicrobium sp.]|jgi:glucose-1-phosphate adenylyltransferase|uniref:glucose-1-phosphate adenylyltransferase subunit GlgD n=1 Tax=Anaeromicrobium sp. TaxID=1929132 RepID=UPI0025EE00AF|nr:glucose-1-phosphate adenylyltransferase subunit GlgD [Anaeromicrobium sp.]MCT4594346.1 glucose-1-phosphate adenylyltransferase subunit GlgD [Anaeromicrobium sp.]
MKDLMGIINLSENEEEIKDITYNRPIATVPIGGRYRVIDFTLSNMINAGIHNISIFTRGKSRSLMDHIGTGKPWDLDRKNDGLFVLNPVFNVNNVITHRGDLENFKNHLDYIKYSNQEYVLLSKSYMICNMDFREAFKYHKESSAHITIIYKKMTNKDKRFLGRNILNLDEKGRVMSIGNNAGNRREYNISMEMYLMKKELFLNIIEDSLTLGDSEYIKQAIFKRVDTLNVNGYPYEGYLACINSIENYYETSMDILNMNVSKELFHKEGLIYTKTKDEPPAKYTQDSHVKNSLVANGCIIEGTLENCIVGRGVKIKKGAVVKDSIIMQKSIIEDGSHIKNAILDKYVHITENKILGGDRKNPLVIKKGIRI